MSDLSLQLRQASSQLPVASYFDEALYTREMQNIFAFAPRYVGHASTVANLGDYYALPQEQEGRALVRHADGIALLSNVCRHRQAIMLKGRGSLASTGGNVVCPLHRWTYSGAHHANEKTPIGTLIGAPHFTHDPCLHLQKYPLQEWNGLLFEGGTRRVADELQGMGAQTELDFNGYVLNHVEMHTCNYNWKTFMEVYLEDYHVAPFHPGLGQFVRCDDLRWEFQAHFSIQTVGITSRWGQANAQAGSAVYERWREALRTYRGDVPPKFGAIWMSYYPHVMVEWYPHVLTVSTLHPLGPRQTLNMVQFFYPEEIAAFEREFVQAQQAAYMETCKEDDEIAERMDAGRAALLARGADESGPYQSPMEDGMQHFHQWYRQRMGAL